MRKEKLTRHVNSFCIDEITDDVLKQFADDEGMYIYQVHRLALIYFAKNIQENSDKKKATR